jgi:uncharacterized protein YqeY
METKARIESDLKDALRSGDETRKRTLRMVIAAIKNAEVDRGGALDEPALLAILQKEVKLRQEAINEAGQAGRTDLAAAAEAEIAVLQSYLPEQLSAAELQSLAQEVIAELGATSMADMGKVIKTLMARVQGRAPGDQVSAAVRQALQKTG